MSNFKTNSHSISSYQNINHTSQDEKLPRLGSKIPKFQLFQPQDQSSSLMIIFEILKILGMYN